MHLLKGLIIAFSMYSRIPVPQFEWKEEDMRYTLCFFSVGRGGDRRGLLWLGLFVRRVIRE